MDIRVYFDNFFRALESISVAQLDLTTSILGDAYQYAPTIYVIGDGQSAATANAFTLDLTKQITSPHPMRRFRIIFLTDNSSVITPWATDRNCAVIFAAQLKGLFRPEDILVAISVSGNSPNVVQACGWARQQGGMVIGLADCDGGSIKQLADVYIVVNSHNYGHVETTHAAVMHYWVDLFRESFTQ